MRGALTMFVLQFCLILPAVAQGPRGSSEEARAGNGPDLPDAPSAISIQPATGNGGYAVPLAGDPYQPLTKHQKWEHFVRSTYSPSTFVGAGEDIIYSRVTGGFVFCCGIGAWGEQYAAILADKESRQFFGEFLFPTLLKQDPRYFPKRTGGIWSRAWYAATRVVITRNDNGNAALNYSEVLGVAFAKAVSNAYYPDRQRGGWQTANRIIGTLQDDATSNLLEEFWPDIKRTASRLTPKRVQRAGRRVTTSVSSMHW